MTVENEQPTSAAAGSTGLHVDRREQSEQPASAAARSQRLRTDRQHQPASDAHEPGEGFAPTILGALVGLGLAGAGFAIGVGLTGLAGETKSFWYLSRSAGFVAYLLLWGSVVWGLLLSTKIGQGRFKPPALLDAHQFLSNVALGFAFFHGLVLMGDRYLSFPLQAILVPFAGAYKPALVAAGQLGLWLSLLLSLSFLVRQRIGPKLWRRFHYASFVAFWAVLVHSVWLGSDNRLLAVQLFYLATAAAVLFLTFYRILASGKRSRTAPAPAATPRS